MCRQPATGLVDLRREWHRGRAGPHRAYRSLEARTIVGRRAKSVGSFVIGERFTTVLTATGGLKKRRLDSGGIAQTTENLYDHERIGAAAYRPNPEVRSASLSRATDLYFERDPFDHEPHDENHNLTLLSAS